MHHTSHTGPEVFNERTEPVFDAGREPSPDQVPSIGRRNSFAESQFSMGRSIQRVRSTRNIGSMLQDFAEEEPTPVEIRRRKRPGLAQRVLEYIFPPGSMLSSAFTLGSSTLGGGILGLPFAFNMTGYILSIILLVVVSILTVFSLWLLAHCSDNARKRTYEDTMKVLMGRGPDWLVSIFMCGFCIGGGVGYIISIGNLLTPVFENEGVPHFLTTKPGNRLITSMVWLVLILPLCLPKQIDSLRHTSLLGCLCILFFVICIVIDASRYTYKDGFRKDLEMFGHGNTAIEGLGMVMFACLVQINAFEVYFEMSHPTPRRMMRDSAIAMGACGLLYVLAGFFGYMRFGKTVTASILLLYQPGESVLFAIAYVGIVFKICVAFALHQLPMRDGIYHLLGWDVYLMPWWQNAVFCTFLSFVLLLAGLFVPNINIVFGLVGSLCGGFIGYIFPSLMYMYSGNFSLKRKGYCLYFATYFLLVVGCIATVFGTGASIYGVAA
ncbi:putative transmembrane amino acid transporter [Trypanosoma conorhini]|uniref:Putative transmembrane amino acid transporter n=1 Tax=Trypanosoma conorhini TaxID=83891 RepID=A0A3R7KQ78_9TRYP|nr:putative transmembrane amino acid transporter [Trypanosoma conorhini]RNF13241.1 putative transmembrane amino acid transporter [Trypanosoma conorhini]